MFQFIYRKDYRSFSDEELVALYKKEQNNVCIDVIFERYGHMLLAISIKYLKRRDDAEDIVMTLFEHLGQKLLKFEIQNFRSWIHTTIRNECLMFLRKNKSLKHNLTLELADNQIIEELITISPAEKERQLLLLEEALKNLKFEQQRCIQLFFLEGKSYLDIAIELKLSLNNVKSAIQNGRRMLKINLEKLGLKSLEL